MAIGVEDAEFGQRLKAFVVLKPNEWLLQEELIDWLKVRAARYQIPKSVVFMSQLPYTPLGKPDKKKLRISEQ